MDSIFADGARDSAGAVSGSISYRLDDSAQEEMEALSARSMLDSIRNIVSADLRVQCEL